MADDWSPSSWRSKPAAQQVVYPETAGLRQVLDQIVTLPPLVTSWEVETLREQLAEAARGRRFLLQGGDCSESFNHCRAEIIVNKLKILLQMSVVLVYGCKKPVIRVGRFAGQYSKPRSSNEETQAGLTLPSYRGDNINRIGFTKADRTADPQLLLRGFERSALTLNFIRSLIAGGFADLHHPDLWNLAFVDHATQAADYRQMVSSIADAIRFLETVANARIDQLNTVEFFTSHEGLHLEFEESQIRKPPRRTSWYNLGTHFPWIGDRTRAIDGAHVEMFRGIANPVGVKVGPAMTPDELVHLAGILDPNQVPGRLTIIHRFGANRIQKCLPPLVEAVRRTGRTLLWCCDPMHGNTITTQSGIKTRDFSAILQELDHAFAIHQSLGSILGGVHFELTGDNVTECIGGAGGPQEADLGKVYESLVDPRLNYQQALEMALLIARRMSQEQKTPR